MVEDRVPKWSFLTNHARVLLCIAQDPGMRLREIGDSVGITERAVHRIVAELSASGYISRTRDGRRSHYAIQAQLPLPDSLARGQRVGALLALLATPNSIPIPRRPAGRAHRARRPASPLGRQPTRG